MAEKQSLEGNGIFASKQKQAHMKLVLSCRTGKPRHGPAWMAAEATCRRLSRATSLLLTRLSRVLQSQPG